MPLEWLSYAELMAVGGKSSQASPKDHNKHSSYAGNFSRFCLATLEPQLVPRFGTALLDSQNSCLGEPWESDAFVSLLRMIFLFWYLLAWGDPDYQRAWPKRD